MIIDTHTHIYDPSRPEGVPWPPEDDELLYRTVLPEHFLEVASPHGVTGTVVVEADCTVECNQWVLDIAADDPAIVAYVGRLQDQTPRFSGQVERFAANPLFRGVRIWPPWDFEKGFLDDMAVLADKGLVLDALIIEPEMPAQMLAVMEKHPSLRIVFEAIAGNSADDGEPPSPEWVDQLNAFARHPHACMKAVGFSSRGGRGLDHYRPTLDAMWDAFGEDRLMYGSNWPVSEKGCSYSEGIGNLKQYFEEKGPEAAEKFFWKNAKAAYGWPDR